MTFFIQADNGAGDRYQLDATVNVSYKQSGTVTSYAVEEGTDSSDHYKQNPDTVHFEGVISKVKFLRNSKVKTDLAIFEKGMQDLKRSGKFFACSFSNNLDTMKNCLFTDLTMSRDPKSGLHAMNVRFTITQTRVSNQAKLSTIPIPASQYKDMLEDKKKGKGTSTEVSKTEEGYLTGVRRRLLGEEDTPDVEDSNT